MALFSGRNPLLLNGITSIVDRPDLGERCVFVTLEPIEKSRRRLERDIWREAKSARPSIFGALLDAAAYGLQRMDATHLDELPRMADFVLWVTACEGALWEPGSFISAYNANQLGAVEEGIAHDLIASAIRDLMSDSRVPWTGTCADLLKYLNDLRGYDRSDQKAPKDWPQTPRKISSQIDRASAALRTVGISITRERRSGSKRLITIENIPSSPPTNSSDTVTNVTTKEKSSSYEMTVHDDSDGMENEPVTAPSCENPSGVRALEDSDGGDGVPVTLRDGDMGWGYSDDGLF